MSALVGFLRHPLARARLQVLRRRFGYRLSPRAKIHPLALFDTRFGGTVSVDDDADLREGVLLSPHGGSIHVGEKVYLGPYSVVYGHGGVTIGADTLIAAHCVIIPASHTYRSREKKIAAQGLTAVGIHIGRDVWLGTGVRILDGVTVGDGCVVAAGAVVTKSIEEYSVVAGIPARVIKKRG